MPHMADWIVTDDNWATDLHRKVEEELTRLYDEEDNPEAAGETPSGQPFCGCQTCEVREILVLSTQATVDAIAAGTIIIEFDSGAGKG